MPSIRRPRLPEALLLCALLLCAAPPARADTGSVGVVVLPEHGDDLGAGRAMTRRLLRALAGDQAVSLVDLLGEVEQLSRPPRPDYIQELQAGLEQLAQGSYGSARRTLARVLSRMTRALASVPLEELAFVQLHLAAAELGAGRRGSAQRTMSALKGWRRGRLPQLSGQAPTDWEDLLANTLAPAGRDGTIEVRSEPEGALASLDGQPLGPTPATATNLPPGTHYLQVTLPGYQPSVMAVRVSARRRSVSLRLSEDPAAQGTVSRLLSLRAGLGSPRLSGVDSLGQQLGLDRVLMVTLSHAAAGVVLRSHLYNAATEKLEGSKQVLLTGAGDASQLQPLALWRPAAAVPAPTPVAVMPAEVDLFKPWYKRWYVWVLVGAVAAAAVAIPVSLTSQEETTADKQFVIRW